MKKIYSFIICLLPLMAAAQITLTQSDLPYAGVAWTSAVNNSYSAAIPAGGANQSWDYSTLLNVNVDTTLFLPVGGPQASMFPSANCATYDPSNGQWQYFLSNSSGFYFMGGNYSGFFLVLSPPWQYFSVPFTYNNTSNTIARTVIDTVYSTYPARFIYNVHNNILADGWGSLTLPTGTYPNTLRQKTTTYTSDTILVDLTHSGTYVYYNSSTTKGVSYQWLRNGTPGSTLLLTMDADTAGTTAKNSSYYLNSIILSAGNSVSDNKNLAVYPNPASSTVHFNLEGSKGEHAFIKVYNSLGEEVMSYEMNGISYYDLPVNRLANGIYYYSLITDSEKQTGKFNVAR